MVIRKMHSIHQLPKIYPILDVSFIPPTGRAEYLHKLGSELANAGVTLLEYRNKTGAEAELLADVKILRTAMPAGQVGFDGVHVDAGDMKPAEARRLLGPERIIGTLGGSAAFFPGVLAEPVDYFSIGPVFPTRTKQTSTPPIGMDGVKRLRAEAGAAPVLVAIGGITLTTAAEAISAGASVVAIAGALFRQPDPAAEFRKWIKLLG